MPQAEQTAQDHVSPEDMLASSLDLMNDKIMDSGEDLSIDDQPDEGASDDAEAVAQDDDGDEPKVDSDTEAGVPAKSAKGQAVDKAGQPASKTKDADAPSLQLAEGLSLKVGDKLTAQHLKQIERSFLRESDYTRKTQEVARIRDEANQVIQTRDAIVQDPTLLRQHFSDEQIMKAFNPHELLHIGLSVNRVPPQVWNDFLKNFQEASGGEAGRQAGNWQADPNARVIGSMSHQIKALNNKLSSFERANAESAAKVERDRRIRELDNEVVDALKTTPGVTKKELLRELVVDGSQRTVAQIAKALKAEKDADRQQYLTGKGEVRKRKMPTMNGHSVPVMPKRPTTWAEADEMLEALSSAGKLVM